MTTDDLHERQIEILEQVEAGLNQLANAVWERAISHAMHNFNGNLSKLAAAAWEKAINRAAHELELSQKINQRLSALQSHLPLPGGLPGGQTGLPEQIGQTGAVQAGPQDKT